MPTNKNAMTRYKILDNLLSSRYHNYSIDDFYRRETLRPRTLSLTFCAYKCALRAKTSQWQKNVSNQTENREND